MANTTGFAGFTHIGFLPGFSADYQPQAKLVTSANATAIYRGDTVVFSSGYIYAGTVGTGQVDGIFDGCQYVDSTGQTKWSPYCPASTTATAYILASPGSIFKVQSNGTAVSRANVNKNAGFATGTGQTTGGGFSLYTLDAAQIGTTNTLPFRIIGLLSDVDPSSVNGTDNTTNNNIALVTFNNQDFKAGQTGV